MSSITNVTIERADVTKITFEWDEVISYDHVVLWSLFASDASGRTRQFGYKIIDGQPAAQFIFNHNSARQDNVLVAASLGDLSLQIRFTAAAVDGQDLQSSTDRHAVLTVDGLDVSRYDLPAR